MIEFTEGIARYFFDVYSIEMELIRTLKQKIPPEIVYKGVLPFIPLLGIDAKTLQNQIYMNKTRRIISNLYLENTDAIVAMEAMRSFDFIHDYPFECSSGTMFLSVFFKTRKDDYVLIFS